MRPPCTKAGPNWSLISAVLNALLLIAVIYLAAALLREARSRDGIIAVQRQIDSLNEKIETHITEATWPENIWRSAHDE